MAKFCNNGHQMEDSWTDCPYCMKTGYRMSSTLESGKTRPDMGATRPDDKSAVANNDKTVLLATMKRAPVVGWLVVVSGAQKGEDFRLHEGKNALGSAGDA